ncbi:hypothetical protein FKO01_04105 [Mesorhizobium sp. B2-3-3]|nr:hypothetical protein FKO01_04105 [Mesorhizobium sp. B2-3-3]
MTDVDGTEHDADRIPAGVIFEKLNFMTVAAFSEGWMHLPKSLTVRGDLDLREASFRSLPEGLRVGEI